MVYGVAWIFTLKSFPVILMCSQSQGPFSERNKLHNPGKVLLSKRNNEEHLILHKNFWESQFIPEKYICTLFFSPSVPPNTPLMKKFDQLTSNVFGPTMY